MARSPETPKTVGFIAELTESIQKRLSSTKIEQSLAVKTDGKDGVGTTYKDFDDMFRVKRTELEAAWRNDGLVFNGINKLVQIVMSAGYEYVGEEESVQFIKNFYDNIGAVGSDLDEHSLWYQTYLHNFVFGEDYHELVFNKKGDKIVDIEILDPKQLDFAKTSMNKVVFKDGSPIGYVQKLPSGIQMVGRFPVPKKLGIELDGGIYYPRETVAHYKLFTIGNAYRGVGLVEPIYLDSKYKGNMQNALANSWLRLGFPIAHTTIGDPLHQPTEQQLTDGLRKVSNLNNSTAISTPYNVDVKLLQAKSPEKIKEQLGYFSDNQVTGMGIPSAFASGKGEATNRATLNRQEYVLKLALKEITRRVCRQKERQEINRIIEWENKSRPKNKQLTPVKVEWKEIATEELDAKVKRMVMLAGAGLLIPDDAIEKYVRGIEQLPAKGKPLPVKKKGVKEDA